MKRTASDFPEFFFNFYSLLPHCIFAHCISFFSIAGGDGHVAGCDFEGRGIASQFS